MTTLVDLRTCLVDDTAPMGKRTRCVFMLKQIGGTEAVDALAEGLKVESVLLSHEVAYVLGQMKDTHAIPYLTATLEDTKLNPILRHEAAEALGAIGDPSSLEVLTKYLKDPVREVADTCELAIDKINSTGQGGSEDSTEGVYGDDPAPAIAAKTVEELQERLNDGKLKLFERYRAMFGLRNLGTEEAVLALCSGFDDESALFKHEIAFVLGQLKHTAAVPALTTMLKDKTQHPMVRHEAAESLGSIGEESEGVVELLQSFKNDSDDIVRESCDVALDIADYWASEEV